MSRTELGDRLLVVVDPDSNGGVDTAPADVVAVHKDGTINVIAHLNQPNEINRWLTDLKVYGTRAQLDKALDEQRANLVGSRHNPGGDKEEWRDSDVYRWVPAAYPVPAKTAAAKTETPAKNES